MVNDACVNSVVADFVITTSRLFNRSLRQLPHPTVRGLMPVSTPVRDHDVTFAQSFTRAASTPHRSFGVYVRNS